MINSVLDCLRHREVVEDQHDDKDVVHAERLFDHVAGEERERRFAALPHPENPGEDQRQRHPDRRPNGRFPRLYLVNLPLKDPQIQRQHREDECDETNPEPDVRGDHEGPEGSGTACRGRRRSSR
jgi:hypothetical protein